MPELEDIYQNSFLALWENIRTGKIELQVSLRAYLFGVFKNQMFKYLRHERSATMDSLAMTKDSLGITNDQELRDWNELQTIVFKVAEFLGEPCYTILLLYFEGKRMDEIATQINFKNSDSVKTKKNKCINLIKKAILKYYGNEIADLKLNSI
jgi:RNA polymerase sigma factor (sigma-70 family)